MAGTNPDTSNTPSRLVVDIAILTYKRPDHLHACLESVLLRAQVSDSFSIRQVTVVDNDPASSARNVTRDVGATSKLNVWYVCEPEPGVSAARNRALQEARGADILVFIDDDEVVTADWPGGLLRVMEETGAAMVGGPVRTEFTHTPPAWVVEGGYFRREEPPSCTPQSWLRTGNLALRLNQIGSRQFDPSYGLTGGEDVAFSSDIRRQGGSLQWSSTAVVTELVDETRTTLEWVASRQRTATANYYRAHRSIWPGWRLRIRIARTVGSVILSLVPLLVRRRDPNSRIHLKIRLARARGALEVL